MRGRLQGQLRGVSGVFAGRELIHPTPLDEVAAGGDRRYPVDYSHLNIQGCALGAEGLPGRTPAHPDTCTFPGVDVSTEYGWDAKVKMSAPVFTGALGSTEIARKNWEHFAVGAAISGVTIVCGENVCGIDPGIELNSQGKIRRAPDMDRRIETYRRYRRDRGEILVQMNVEDARLGVAEYLIDKHGLDTIELKWGQGAKCIGGEIKVNTLEWALELKKRGCTVTPNPADPIIQHAFRAGAIQEFERHSRLGFVEEDGFYAACDRLRSLGYKRITLATGAYGLRELAMAIKWSSLAGIDLLTIDGGPGGTGMSPLQMEHWGVPAIYLHSAAAQFASRLAAKGQRVSDLAFAGGFSAEDHIFKTLALGSPFVKAVCMGRALMIPGIVGKNISLWMNDGGLPTTISQYGTTPEKIFVCWEQVAEMMGRDEMKRIPLGAVGIYSYIQKLSAGLQQIMAGALRVRSPGHRPPRVDEPNSRVRRRDGHPLRHGRRPPGGRGDPRSLTVLTHTEQEIQCNYAGFERGDQDGPGLEDETGASRELSGHQDPDDLGQGTRTRRGSGDGR